MRTFYLALTPWLVFAVADRSAGLGPPEAAFVASAVATVVVVSDLWLRRWRCLPLLAALIFFVFATVSVATGDAPLAAHYDRAAAVGLLATFLFGSVLWAPLTLVYAADLVPPSRRAAAEFRRLHVRLTM